MATITDSASEAQTQDSTQDVSYHRVNPRNGPDGTVAKTRR